MSTATGEFKDYINPNSLQILTEAMVEKSLADAVAGDKFQFLRKGYFCADIDSRPRQCS
jgi:glutaminyl-tRNA synthetase